MIYITGDCHADFLRFNTENFPEQKEMTKDDYVIICGDFGGVWDYEGESKREKYWLDWLENKPFTTLFVDGNHENFDRLYSCPVKDFCGGKVHEIRPSVLHLIRGEIFKIDGKKIFAFGGARSHDIRDGILDPVKDKALLKMWMHDYTKMFRVNKVSWWEQEMPNEEEMKYGLDNLALHDWKVDYIITHDCAASVQALFSLGSYGVNELNEYLEKIHQECDFSKWFFGHHHFDMQISHKDIELYEQIVRIA